MIILDEQYISKEIKNYIITEKVSVLKNDASLLCLGSEEKI